LQKHALGNLETQPCAEWANVTQHTERTAPVLCRQMSRSKQKSFRQIEDPVVEGVPRLPDHDEVKSEIATSKPSRNGGEPRPIFLEHVSKCETHPKEGERVGGFRGSEAERGGFTRRPLTLPDRVYEARLLNISSEKGKGTEFPEQSTSPKVSECCRGTRRKTTM